MTLFCRIIKGIGIRYIENVMSYPGFVKCRDMQGSILGPLLFIIYVNGMDSSIDPNCKLICHADESVNLFHHKTPKFILEKIGAVLNYCSK